METNLNKKIAEFMQKYSLEAINVDTVIKYFSKLKLTNEYGNCLHALVHNKYDEAKVLKLINIFLTAGVDVNLKGQVTGYNFIQLALYGYTKDNKDYSYSTDFILKLIKTAKRYGLNVNTIDNDEDTIVHTALASEVYIGEIIPILNELGDEFDIKRKDNQGHNIYEALLFYKKEASKEKNKIWYNRLTKEEQEIKRIIEVGKYNLVDNLVDIDKKLEEIKIKLENLIEKIDKTNYQTTYEEILKSYQELDFYLGKRELFDKKETSYHLLKENCNKNFRIFINNYIKALIEVPILEELTTLENFLTIIKFDESRDIVLKEKQQFLKSINLYKETISSCNNLNELSKVENNLTSIFDQKVHSELLTLINNRKSIFIGIIDKIMKTKEIICYIKKWMLSQTYFKFSIPSNEEVVDYNDLSQEQLNDNLQKENQILLNLKQDIISETRELFQLYANLIENNIFSQEDILDTFFKTNIQEKSIILPKIKVKTKKKGIK